MTDKDIPAEYVLGKGHVTFFYNKLWFLTKRFTNIVIECQRRGFNITHAYAPIVHVSNEWFWGDYEPTPKAIALNEARIKERMPK